MSVSKRKTSVGLLGSIVRKIFGSKTKRCDAINEVLFYGTKDEERTKQLGLNNLFCIYYVIIHASRSIDVCVPSLASETIAKCLIAVQQKNNVKIRVTIHNSADFHNLQSFAQNGIEVKVINAAERLEHEFILIDGECEDAVAVVGSLDYETSHVNCNRDATMLTSELAVVKALKAEYDRIWANVEHLPTDKWQSTTEETKEE